MAGIEQQDGRRDDSSSLSFWPSSWAAINRMSRSSPGLLAPLGDVAARKSVKLVRGLVGRLLGLVRAAMHVHGDHLCDQSSSCGPISTGTPSISAMMVIGIGAAKADSRSTSPGFETVDQFVGQRFDTRPQSLDLARDESAIDQRPEPGVHRRLQFQHRIGLDASKAARCVRSDPTPRLSGMPAGFWRPKRRSRNSRLTSSKPPKHQKP